MSTISSSGISDALVGDHLSQRPPALRLVRLGVELYNWIAILMIFSFFLGSPSSSQFLPTVGVRLSSSCSLEVARRHLDNSSTMYAGMRIVLAELTIARLIDCLIQ